jgi:hypothetical protein
MLDSGGKWNPLKMAHQMMAKYVFRRFHLTGAALG